MSLDNAITQLVSRLETVTARLESVEKQLASGGGAAPAAAASGGGGGGGATAAWQAEYDDLVTEHLTPFFAAAKSLGDVVQTQAEIVRRLVDTQKAFLGVVAGSKKPADAQLGQLFAPQLALGGEITQLREKNRASKLFNNLSAVSEGIGAFGWVTVTPTPAPFIDEQRAQAEFYSNRILKEFKGTNQTHVDFANSWIGFLKGLAAYVKKNHTTGASWNPRGSDAPASAPAAAAGASSTTASAGGPPPPPPPPAVLSAAEINAGASSSAPPKKAGGDMNALFSAINQGTGVTSGLKKVSDDMKTHKNPSLRAGSTVPAGAEKSATSSTASTASTGGAVAKKKTGNPKVALDGNKWAVEWQVGVEKIVISETEPKHTVYVYNCERSVIVIQGKINAITLDSCKKVGIVFDSAIASCEMVNCTSVEIQILGSVPNITIDKTSGAQIYLSKDCLNAEIITAKSSEMNVLIPVEGDADPVEVAIPEQFRTVVKGRTLVTECVQHAG